MEEILYKLGIPTLFTTIRVLLTGATQQNLNQTMITSIGRIYGLSTYTDTPTPLNAASITTANATNLYLTFKKGSNDFAGAIRLSDMNYNPLPAATTGFPNKRYLPVNLPGVGGIDLDKSFISNPTAIANLTVSLNLWYIDVQTYNLLEQNKIVLRNGLPVN